MRGSLRIIAAPDSTPGERGEGPGVDGKGKLRAEEVGDSWRVFWKKKGKRKEKWKTLQLASEVAHNHRHP